MKFLTSARQVALGVALVGVAFVLGTRSANSSDVPNDPNIGAGLLLIGGVVLAVAGATRWWSDRGRSGN